MIKVKTLKKILNLLALFFILLTFLVSCLKGGTSGSGSAGESSSKPAIVAKDALLIATPDPQLISEVNKTAKFEVAIQNKGQGLATNIKIEDIPHPFYLAKDGNKCNGELLPNKICIIEFDFNPTEIESSSKSMNLSYVNKNNGFLNKVIFNASYLVHGSVNLDFSTLPKLTSYVNESTSATLTITNSGTEKADKLNFTNLIPPLSIKSTNCGTFLDIGSSCNVVIESFPVIIEDSNQKLNVNYNDPLTHNKLTREVDVHYSGLGKINLTFSNMGKLISYPNESVEDDLTIANNSKGDAKNLQFSSLTNSLSIVSNNCGTNLKVGSSCAVRIKFLPTSILNGSQDLIVKYKDPFSDTVPLSQTAKIEYASISKTLLNLSVPRKLSAMIASTDSLDLTVTNISNINVENLEILSLVNPLSIPSKTCGSSLSPGGTCKISIKLISSSLVNSSQQLNVKYKDPVHPANKLTQIAPISYITFGTASLRAVSASPDNVKINNIHQVLIRVFTITNSGNGNAFIDNFTFAALKRDNNTHVSTPWPRSYFSLNQNNCPSPIAPNGTCQIKFNFPYPNDMILYDSYFEEQITFHYKTGFNNAVSDETKAREYYYWFDDGYLNSCYILKINW